MGTRCGLGNQPRKPRSNNPILGRYCLSFLCFTLSSSHHHPSYIHSRTYRRIGDLPLHHILLNSSSLLSPVPISSPRRARLHDNASPRSKIPRALGRYYHLHSTICSFIHLSSQCCAHCFSHTPTQPVSDSDDLYSHLCFTLLKIPASSFLFPKFSLLS